MFDQLEKYVEYENIPYVGDYHCICGESGFFNLYKRLIKPLIIGWCDTPRGFMIVFECPVCGQKFRTHASLDRFDFEAFKYAVENYWQYVDVQGN